MKKFIKNLMVVILSILLVITIFCTILIFNIDKITSKENIRKYVSSVDIMKVEIGDISVENMISNYTNNNDLSTKYIKAMFNTPKVQKLFEDSVADMFDYAVYGNEIPYVTSEKIENMIEYDKIEENLNTKLTEVDKQKIKGYSKDAASQINNFIDQHIVSNENKKTNDEMKNIRWIFSTELKVYMIISIIILTFLICLLKWNLLKSLIPLGVVSIITGCLLFISSLLIKIVFILFKIDNKETLKFILNIIKDLRYNLNLSGIIITIVGIIMIILYNIIKKKKNSK